MSFEAPRAPFRLRRNVATESASAGLVATGIGGIVMGFIGLIALMAVVHGFVLTVLWQWFVQPVFQNAPDINIGQAIGLGMIVGYLTKGSSKTDGDWSGAILRPFTVLGIAAILHFVFGVGT